MNEEALVSATELLTMEKEMCSYKSEVLPVDSTTNVSSRGKAALSPSLPYIKSFYKCLDNPVHPVKNPSGYIALCVAESKLDCKKVLAERLSRPSVGKQVFLDDDAYNYGDFRGLFKVRQVIAQFLEEFFLKKSASSDGIIDPNHICIGSGASSVLGHLFYALAERRDAVLIPAPYYNAFENDMKQIAGCVPIPVYMKDCTLGPTVEELEEAALQAEQQGLTVKILLITNPNNPLGVIYRPDTVLHAIEWARKRKMHSIVDELYALSIHDVSLCFVFFECYSNEGLFFLTDCSKPPCFADLLV
jgi:aspartate/methionine/tyrosine aminotransferase